MTTPEQRARWAALAEAASEGPWVVVPENWEFHEHVTTDSGEHIPYFPTDNTFIAAAREAVPALLAENAALREALVRDHNRLHSASEATLAWCGKIHPLLHGVTAEEARIGAKDEREGLREALTALADDVENMDQPLLSVVVTLTKLQSYVAARTLLTALEAPRGE